MAKRVSPTELEISIKYSFLVEKCRDKLFDLFGRLTSRPLCKMVIDKNSEKNRRAMK